MDRHVVVPACTRYIRLALIPTAATGIVNPRSLGETTDP
jgi:hypothetical protein